MRPILIAAALVLVSSVAPAWAQDNPACAKFEEPFAYNACLAKLGPKAGATLAVPEPAGAAPGYAPPLRRAAFARCTPSRPHGEAMAGSGWSSRSRRDREARVDDRPGIRTPRPPSFSPSFSKSRLFCSKLFQTFLWRFCGISRGYKASKPTLTASKFFGPRSAEAIGRSRPAEATRTTVASRGGADGIRRSSQVREDRSRHMKIR